MMAILSIMAISILKYTTILCMKDVNNKHDNKNPSNANVMQ